MDTGTPCVRCRQAVAPGAPAWQGHGGERLCLPCAMRLALPDREPGEDGSGQPRYALPPAVADAVLAEIDIGTGASWPARVADFSADGLRLVARTAVPPETPTVVTLRDRTGAVPPAVLAVEVRWIRRSLDGEVTIGVRVITVVDGHHVAFLARVLERVTMRSA